MRIGILESINHTYYDLINNYQAIAAALIGVFSAIIVSLFQYFTTTIIKNNEKTDFEKAVVSSIYEELIGLYNCYDEDFQKAILNIPDDEYMTTTFTITQDFFTIYHNNASNIGKIKKQEIRNLVVQIYLLLKTLLENLLHYKSKYNSFMERRIEFVSRLQGHINPKSFSGLFISDEYLVDELCRLFKGPFSSVKYEDIVDTVMRLNASIPNTLKLDVFIAGDIGARNGLIIQTNELKSEYKEIREKIIEITELIKNEYKITSDTVINKNLVVANKELSLKTDFRELEQASN